MQEDLAAQGDIKTFDEAEKAVDIDAPVDPDAPVDTAETKEEI